jgi:polyvinyl alcohol dehydrogenase (cytochrome)
MRKRISVWLVTTLTAAMGSTAFGQDGATLYRQYCAICHEQSARTRAPERESLKQRTPESIYEALRSGNMGSTMATGQAALTETQKRTLAEYLAGRPLGGMIPSDAASMPNKCSSAPLNDPLQGAAWNGWGAGLHNARYQPAAAAGLTAAQVPQLKLKWAFGLPNVTIAYGAPTVAGGRVYIPAENGYVYSLNAQTGCVYWSFEAKGAIRAAITIAKLNRPGPPRYAAYFADQRANVYAVDAATGELIWTQLADPFPIARITGSPVVYEGRLYVGVSAAENVNAARLFYECCTFRGSLVAYDAATGKLIWRSYTIPEEPKPTKKGSTGTQLYGPAGASIWSAPTIDPKRHLVYVTTAEAFTHPAAPTTDSVIAMDLETGKIRWSFQGTSNDVFVVGCPNRANLSCPDELGPDFDFGSSAILRTLPNGKDIVVAPQKSGVTHGVDPDTGKVLWQTRVGKGSTAGGTEWGAAADNRYVYVPNADTRFGPAEAGGLAALDLATGKQIWFVKPPVPDCTGKDKTLCMPAQSAAVTAIDGAVFSGAVNGVMRAYSTLDGRVLWEYDTVKEYKTVNGVPGKGGSINGAGPAVAGGMVFFNSGYGKSGVGGNVLLAFAPE